MGAAARVERRHDLRLRVAQPSWACGAAARGASQMGRTRVVALRGWPPAFARTEAPPPALPVPGCRPAPSQAPLSLVGRLCYSGGDQHRRAGPERSGLESPCHALHIASRRPASRWPSSAACLLPPARSRRRRPASSRAPWPTHRAAPARGHRHAPEHRHQLRAGARHRPDGRFRGLLLPLGPTGSPWRWPASPPTCRKASSSPSARRSTSRSPCSSRRQPGGDGDGRLARSSRRRAPRAPRASASRRSRGFRTTAATSSSFMQLTPGVSIVQGPDGDEITVNGQKGIANNVSVDGADFNNPFFGEQRGGQRPAFTFNLDAVKEMVVVSDGANAEFGRRCGAFVNVVTKSGTNDVDGVSELLLQVPRGSLRPTTSRRREVRVRPGPVRRHPRRPDHEGQAVLLPLLRPAAAPRPSRSTPTASSSAWSTTSPASAAPTRTARSRAVHDARVVLGKLDWLITQRHLATLRCNYTWAKQENGTFDVDSWGRSANAIESD